MLTPSRVGALAALGMARVEVYDLPRVTILSTGNEIVEPGQGLAPGQIYDINRFTLSAVVADNGGLAVVRRTARDTLADLERAAMPAFKSSGDITSLSQADGCIEIPASVDTIEEGTSVEVTLFL